MKKESLSGDCLRSWLYFVKQKGLSPFEKLLLLKHFSSPCAVFEAKHADLEHLIAGKNWKVLFARRASIEDDLRWLDHDNHHLTTWDSDVYPELLREIPDAPIALFVEGDVNLLKQPQVAVIGSRRASPGGLKVTADFCCQLVEMGLTITSGMALGIDSAAHKAALSAQGCTIAILGCGLDTCYPPRNYRLSQQIIEQGALVSEFPIGAFPARHHFPQRNRVISGLSYGVLVVEAAHKSGSLITARLAMEQNREVFAIPGSILSPLSFGGNQLIREGAVLVDSAEQIVAELRLPLQAALQQSKNDKNAQIHPLIDSIGHHPTTIDEIISSSGLTASEVSSILLVLELDEHIGHCGDGKYVRLS